MISQNDLPYIRFDDDSEARLAIRIVHIRKNLVEISHSDSSKEEISRFIDKAKIYLQSQFRYERLTDKDVLNYLLLAATFHLDSGAEKPITEDFKRLNENVKRIQEKQADQDYAIQNAHRRARELERYNWEQTTEGQIHLRRVRMYGENKTAGIEMEEYLRNKRNKEDAKAARNRW